MKIVYKFVKGQAIEIEVDDNIGNVVVELRCREYNNNRKEARKRNLLTRDNETGKTVQIDDCIVDKRVNVEAEVLSRIENRNLRNAIKRLSPRQRELLHKVYYQNIKLTDLAKEYGISYQALQNRLKKIYNQLKKFLN